MSIVAYNQAGYIGQSMSRRAAIAYDNGEKPKSKWTKKAMLAALEEWADWEDREVSTEIAKMKKDEIFNKYFCLTSWHHTGKFANETDFYGVDEYTCRDEFPKLTVDQIAAKHAAREAARQAEQARREERARKIREAEQARRDAEAAFIAEHGHSPYGLEALQATGNVTEFVSKNGNECLRIIYPATGSVTVWNPSSHQSLPYWVETFSLI